MTTITQFTRHQTGGALVIGTAPLKFGAGFLLPGQAVMDEVANILYIAIGNDGSGNSTGIVSIGGAGAFIKSSLIGTANGIASLDSGGKVPTTQLPASIVGSMNYSGTWNASTNTPNLSSGTGTKGAFYKVSVAGLSALDGTSNWNVGDLLTFDGTTWDKIDGPAEAVLSVAGRIGAIVLSAVDISDSGATGRALLQAATAAAAKSALALAVADVSGAAPLASPTLTGTPTAPTATAGTNTTQIATTAFIAAALAPYAPLASPAFTGAPTVPTATAGTNTTQAASTAFVTAAIAAAVPTVIDGGVI